MSIRCPAFRGDGFSSGTTPASNRPFEGFTGTVIPELRLTVVSRMTTEGDGRTSAPSSATNCLNWSPGQQIGDGASLKTCQLVPSSAIDERHRSFQVRRELTAMKRRLGLRPNCLAHGKLAVPHASSKRRACAGSCVGDGLTHWFGCAERDASPSASARSWEAEPSGERSASALILS